MHILALQHIEMGFYVFWQPRFNSDPSNITGACITTIPLGCLDGLISSKLSLIHIAIARQAAIAGLMHLNLESQCAVLQTVG